VAAPAVTFDSPSVFVIDRSADVATAVVSVAVWSLGVGSLVGDEIDTVFDRAAVRDGST
jgi:hypothetical protein